jgi:hypothetical protein
VSRSATPTAFGSCIKSPADPHHPSRPVPRIACSWCCHLIVQNNNKYGGKVDTLSALSSLERVCTNRINHIRILSTSSAPTTCMPEKLIEMPSRVITLRRFRWTFTDNMICSLIHLKHRNQKCPYQPAMMSEWVY